MARTLTIASIAGQTYYAFPANQSFADWSTHRVAFAAGSSPNASRYTASVDEAASTVWFAFAGSSQPAEWGDAIGEWDLSAGLTTAQASQLSTIYDRAVAGTLPESPLPREPGDDLEIIPGDAYTSGSPNGEIVFTLPAGSTTGDDGRLRIYWPGGSIDAASTVTDESGTKRLRFSLTETESGSIPIGADARYQVGTVEADKNWTPIDGPVVIPHRHES